MMKILFIGESYLPQLCGMTSVTRYLAEGLIDKGHSVTIATLSHDMDDKDFDEINKVKVIRFKIHRNILKKPVGEIRRFISYVTNSTFDIYILECMGSITSDILTDYIDEISGTKILYSHGNSFKSMKLFVKRQNLKYTFGNTYMYLRLLYKNFFVFPKLIRAVDEAIILSKIASDKPIVQKYARKYEILDNAADNMFFNEYYNKEQLDYDLGTKYNKYIISIATYSKQKNQIQMVKSYLESDIYEVSLVIIGPKKTDYYEQLLDYINKISPLNLGKDIVVLLDVPRSKLPNILKHSSLYLITSEFEEYSISVIEAMSLGIPYVSTNVGNARILPGGITVENSKELSIAISKILNNTNLHQKLSRDAKRYADKFNSELVVVTKFENIIADACKGKDSVI